MAFVKFSSIALATAYLSFSNLALAGTLDLSSPSDKMTIKFSQAQNSDFSKDPAFETDETKPSSSQFIFLNQTLNDSPANLFCVDLGTAIYDTSDLGIGKSYLSNVRKDGTVDSLNTKLFDVTGNYYATDDKGTVANAGQIAWLVEHDAAGAKSAEERLGLQAAIWKAEYGSNFDLVGPGGDSSTSDKVYEAYKIYLQGAADGKGDLLSTTPSDVAWYSPTTQDGAAVQGLVGAEIGAPVPEPSSIVLALFGVVGACVAPAIKRRMYRK